MKKISGVLILCFTTLLLSSCIPVNYFSKVGIDSASDEFKKTVIPNAPKPKNSDIMPLSDTQLAIRLSKRHYIYDIKTQKVEKSDISVDTSDKASLIKKHVAPQPKELFPGLTASFRLLNGKKFKLPKHKYTYLARGWQFGDKNQYLVYFDGKKVGCEDEDPNSECEGYQVGHYYFVNLRTGKQQKIKTEKMNAEDAEFYFSGNRFVITYSFLMQQEGFDYFHVENNSIEHQYVKFDHIGDYMTDVFPMKDGHFFISRSPSYQFNPDGMIIYSN